MAGSSVVRAQEPAGPPDYAMTVWAGESGSAPGDVFAITEDLAGYLWLGTQTGLMRFDGFRFVTWADSAGVPVPGPVLALAGARDGSVWVGGSNGLYHIQGETIRHFSTADGFLGGVTALIEDRRGTIWAGGRRGLFRFTDGRWVPVGEADGYSGRELFSLHEDQSGRLWVGSASGVYARQAERFEIVDASAVNIQDFAEDDSGGIWVSDSTDIARRLGAPRATRYETSIRRPASAWRLLHDRRGQIWVTALGGGLLRVDGASGNAPVMRRIDYERRVSGATRALYQDREGNIWVGLRGGLLRFSEALLNTDLPLEGLNQDGVRTTAVSGDGSVWVATGHGLNRFAGTTRRTYPVEQTLALHADRRDTMWASTTRGLMRLNGTAFQPVVIPGGINWSRVLAMGSDTTNALWLCSSLVGPMSWDGRTLKSFEGHPLAGRPCSSVLGDRRGRVWVGFTGGSGGGALIYEKGNFQPLGAAEGLTGGSVLAMIEDRAGAVWISTASGLNRYANGHLTSLTSAHVPFVDVVPTLVEDGEGNLWVGIRSGAGLIRVHPRELDKVAADRQAQIDYALFDNSDGLPQGSLSWQGGVTGVRGGDGRLWFAAGLGLATMDPAVRPRTLRAHAPRVTVVVADGRPLPAVRGTTLPAGTNTVRIEYSSLSLSAASKLRFRYMLEGLHNDWVPAGASREAVFADLPSGSYRFRLSSTFEGPWTDGPTWDFSIAPPFYRTSWFLASVAAAVALFLAAAWWLRLQAMRTQYSLVFAERARLSREIHDTLLQGLAALGVELEAIASQLDPAQGEVRDGLRRLRRQVGHSLREARESILDLRRSPMMRRGLRQSLADLAEDTTRRGVQAEFAADGRIGDNSDEVDVQLLRIAQEAVSNAVKHGRAQRVQIGLRSTPDEIVLRVQDDGRGFTPDDPTRGSEHGEHLGLLSMQERAQRIQGRLAITSMPGQGTTVTATVPAGQQEHHI